MSREQDSDPCEMPPILRTLVVFKLNGWYWAHHLALAGHDRALSISYCAPETCRSKACAKRGRQGE